MYVYIHGFNSSPASIKARQLHKRLEALGRGDGFACPALSHWPMEAMRQLETLLQDCAAAEVTLVGSSLGGFYATALTEKHGCRSVLVNPAVEAHLGLEAYLGPQTNLYTGETYQLTRQHLEQFAEWHIEKPARPEFYFLMVTTGDEVLDYRAAVSRYAGSKQLIVHGSDHGFADFEDHLDAVIAFGDGGR
ncbi:MAG: YqiA/YcfP family alpha/beta fold hydrolase [Betaproteobacteria bacterium]